MKAPLAVTMGEPAGIGPDLLLQAWHARDLLPPFFVYADPDLLRRRCDLLNLDVPVLQATEMQALELFPQGLPVVPLERPAFSRPGLPDPATAGAVIESIDRAVKAVREGLAHAVVTAPIAKSVLYAAGFAQPGHTEYLGELADRLWGHRRRPVMMIWSEIVAVVPVTIHIPLAKVPQTLTQELIVETAEIVAHDLAQRFALSNPRLVVTGLNPHAGESGTLGLEERDIIWPAIERLKAQGLDIRGPLPADTLFHARARQTYDVALCMYHDQALAPAKALAFDEAVNVTLGLPFIRTSPDHGTALDLAGTGRANPASFIAALSLAARLEADGTDR